HEGKGARGAGRQAGRGGVFHTSHLRAVNSEELPGCSCRGNGSARYLDRPRSVRRPGAQARGDVQGELQQLQRCVGGNSGGRAEGLIRWDRGVATMRRPILSECRMTTIRDPLWNNIRVDSVARELMDTPVFQRLRYVRQLGWAFLVYPGATHSRFEHALGAYNLARCSLDMLERSGQLQRVRPDEGSIVCAAALLHDVGHYPFSHALEEIGASHHEEVARSLVTEGPVAAVLESALGKDAPARVHDLIRGASASPLQRLISGSLDLDKIDYLKRDAMMCGVPYGE